jgi:hypothetical protein
MKHLVFVVALGLVAGTAYGDNPKTYRINISAASRIGAEELPAGEYKLVVDTHDPKVRLTHVNSGDDFELEAKVEVVGEKFDNTEVHTDTSSGVNRIMEIRVGGSRTRVVFNYPPPVATIGAPAMGPLTWITD